MELLSLGWINCAILINSMLSDRILPMPISLSAKKSLRVSKRNNKKNVSFKTNLRKAVKDYLTKPTSEGLKGIYSLLDKAVKNNIFHANKTARLKAKYTKIADGKAEVKTAPVKKKKTAKKTSKKMK